jgi:hypothetical protein
MNIDSIVKNISILTIVISCLLWTSFARHDFQLIQLGEMARNQFLLDKVSGRVWQKVCDGESKSIGECDGVLIWEEMFVTDLTASDSRPALVYNYIVEQREAVKMKK